MAKLPPWVRSAVVKEMHPGGFIFDLSQYQINREMVLNPNAYYRPGEFAVTWNIEATEAGGNVGVVWISVTPWWFEPDGKLEWLVDLEDVLLVLPDDPPPA